MCKKLFHKSCLGLRSPQPVLVNSNLGDAPAICNKCDNLIRTGALEDLIAKIRSQIHSISSPYLCETYIYEAMDRIRRSTNILVYRFHESEINDKESCLQCDKSKIINEILSFCNVALDTVNITVQRIKVKGANAPRPLRVFLHNKEHVDAILQNSRNCKTGLLFRPDRTPLQRELYKQSKVKLNVLRRQGILNKKIIYVNGIPVIVDVEQSQNQVPKPRAAAILPGGEEHP